MDVVTKEAVASVQSVESGDPNGQFDVILSTDGLDRDGERLYASEWKQPLPSRINFDSDHGMSVEKTVGSGVPTIEDGQLRVRGTFASTPHAQAVRTLVKEGHITQTSVAFMQSKTRKDAKPERELLNGSFVSVPSNPEAVILSAKAVDTENAADAAQPGDTAEDMPGMQDMVQAIHDAACHLGADCAMMNASGASDGANKDFIRIPPDFLNSVAISRPGLATGLKAADKPYGDVAYADPANGKYPIDTEAHARAAWSYIHMPKNRTDYTADELSAIEGRIRSALNKFGVEISDSLKSVGSPISAVTSTAAAAEKSAAAAVVESADVALQARSLAFLITQAAHDADDTVKE